MSKTYKMTVYLTADNRKKLDEYVIQNWKETGKFKSFNEAFNDLIEKVKV